MVGGIQSKDSKSREEPLPNLPISTMGTSEQPFILVSLAFSSLYTLKIGQHWKNNSVRQEHAWCLHVDDKETIQLNDAIMERGSKGKSKSQIL